MAESAEDRKAAAEELRRAAQQFTKPPETDSIDPDASPLHFVQERARALEAAARQKKNTEPQP